MRRRKTLGVTMGYDLRPAHLFEFEDGMQGVIWGYRVLHPDHFDSAGWSLDPDSGVRLDIYREREPEAVRAASRRWLRWVPRWLRRPIVSLMVDGC